VVHAAERVMKKLPAVGQQLLAVVAAKAAREECQFMPNNYRRVLAVAGVLGALTASLAGAQPPPYSRDEDGRVVVRATRIDTPVRVDGRLDDEVYGQVEAITQFIQQEPKEGAPVSEKTEAWVLYDDDNIYFSCRCWDTHPERIVANDMRRDSPNLRNNDNFAIELDTFHDRRNGFLFYVTPLGGLFDGLTTDERANNSDWNTVWEGKVGRFDGGWIAEIAIPFKSLRYAPGRDQTWGINLRRNIRAKNEWAYITPMKPAWGQTAIFRVSAAATLVGVQAPPTAKNLEIKPYAISRLTTDLVSNPTLHNEVKPDAGLDVKYGLTKGLTADITYRTDFAQVEEDEAQVNLTRFNLGFPEKREFFLEGAGTFNFGTGGPSGGGSGGAPSAPGAGGSGAGGDAPLLFYSRRIGLSGGRSVPILGGGRLTGRAGGWNIGALNISSDDDAASAALQTNFTVLRVRRDVLRRSTIGGIFTSRSRSVLARSGSNQVWGLDGNFAFFQNVYVSGFVAQSRTDGRHGGDFSYRTQFNYAADRYGLTLDRIVVDPNFNPEVGFLRRLNFRKHTAAARFSPRPAASRRVRKYYYEATLDYTTDDKNVLETRTAQGVYRMELQNSDLLSVIYSRNFEYLALPFQISDTVRIPVGRYEFNNVSAVYNPGQQHRVSGSGSIDVGTFYDGRKTTAAFRGRVSVTPKLAFEPNVSLNWIDLPQRAFTNTVIGERTLYTMTPRMFMTALVQYSSSTTSLSGNVRFRWEYQPGSELFVVYTEGRDTLLSPRIPLETRGFVIKINRLLRF
jgi:hypothetical protein